MSYSYKHKSAGILIKDRKILLGRPQGEEFFISPGGFIESGETSEQALVRELQEELSININEASIKKFETFFTEEVINETIKLKMDAHFVDSWEGEPSPSREIEEILWIDSQTVSSIKVGCFFEHNLIMRLKQANLID